MADFIYSYNLEIIIFSLLGTLLTGLWMFIEYFEDKKESEIVSTFKTQSIDSTNDENFNNNQSKSVIYEDFVESSIKKAS